MAKRSCCHHQNVFISSMDNDVTLEILVQLPPISVVRFKLVSKAWYALISDSNFLFRHSLYYHRHIQETRRIDHLSDGLCFGPMSQRINRLSNGLCIGRPMGGDDGHHPSRQYDPHFQHQPDYLIFPPPPIPNHDNPHPPPPMLRILYDHPLDSFPIDVNHHPMTKFSLFTLSSFSNGLVIFRGHHDIYDEENSDPYFQSTYFICNPMLKQYIELPKTEYQNVPYDNSEEEDGELVPIEPPTYTYEPIIVFDPTTTTISSLSYKVFLLRRVRVHDSAWIDFSLQIYAYSQPSSSSEVTSLWRLITIVPDWDHELDSGNGVLLNGVLYHLCSNEVILCIHVAKEIVWFLDCPSLPMESTTSHRYQYFGECGGHLQLVAKDYDAATFCFPCSLDVFEMEQPQQHDDDLEVVHSAVWIWKHCVRNIRPQPSYDHILREQHSIHIIRFFKTGRKGEEEALLMKISPRVGDGMMLIFNLTSNTFGELLDIPFNYLPDKYTNVFPYTMTLFPLSSSS